MTSYNLYAYCSNNPIMYNDPTGRIAIPAPALPYIVPLLPLIPIGIGKGLKALNEIKTGLIDLVHDIKRKMFEKKETEYWYAEIQDGKVVALAGVNFKNAKILVASNKNIVAIDYKRAKKLADQFPHSYHDKWPEEEGYLPHFHSNRKKRHAHIWYYY